MKNDWEGFCEAQTRVHDLNQDDGWHRYPLNEAASRGLIRMVKYLVERGARVDMLNELQQGHTPLPLWAAKYRGDTDIIDYLEVRLAMEIVMETDMLPHCKDVRNIITQYMAVPVWTVTVWQ